MHVFSASKIEKGEPALNQAKHFTDNNFRINLSLFSGGASRFPGKNTNRRGVGQPEGEDPRANCCL